MRGQVCESVEDTRLARLPHGREGCYKACPIREGPCAWRMRRLQPRSQRWATKGETTMKRSDEWIDVTTSLEAGMAHWPGDPGVSVERVQDITRGHSANVSLLHLGSHSGTHVDPP